MPTESSDDDPPVLICESCGSPEIRTPGQRISGICRNPKCGAPLRSLPYVPDDAVEPSDDGEEALDDPDE